MNRLTEDDILERIDAQNLVDKMFGDDSPLSVVEKAVAVLLEEGYTPQQINRHFEYSSKRAYQVIESIKQKLLRGDVK